MGVFPPAKMQRTQSVSVIVPVYNRLGYFPETLGSVFAQTFQNWELIVVDDGSQEDVAGLVAQYKHPRIRLVRQSNQGNAAARNTGIACAQNEFVICLDSDDVWHPEMLETSVAFLHAHPEIDVAYTQVQTIDASGQPLPRPAGPRPPDGDLLPLLLAGYPVMPSSALARRSCFGRWGTYTPGLDDWELWLRWSAQGCRFACIERPLLYYRIHDSNFHLDYDRRRQAHFAMLDKFYEQENLPETAVRRRERAYANQHFRFAVLAWQLGRQADGTAEFVLAARDNPAYLTDLDFYTRIACAHQGKLDTGTERGLDLPTAEATLRHCLDAFFTRPDLTQDLRARRSQAYGHAFLALARTAYGVAQDMGQARRWLWQAVRAWPPLALRTDWSIWLARSFAGYGRLQVAKKMLHKGAKYA